MSRQVFGDSTPGQQLDDAVDHSSGRQVDEVPLDGFMLAASSPSPPTGSNAADGHSRRDGARFWLRYSTKQMRSDNLILYGVPTRPDILRQGLSDIQKLSEAQARNVSSLQTTDRVKVDADGLSMFLASASTTGAFNMHVGYANVATVAAVFLRDMNRRPGRVDSTYVGVIRDEANQTVVNVVVTSQFAEVVVGPGGLPAEANDLSGNGRGLKNGPGQELERMVLNTPLTLRYTSISVSMAVSTMRDLVRRALDAIIYEAAHDREVVRLMMTDAAAGAVFVLTLAQNQHLSHFLLGRIMTTIERAINSAVRASGRESGTATSISALQGIIVEGVEMLGTWYFMETGTAPKPASAGWCAGGSCLAVKEEL